MAEHEIKTAPGTGSEIIYMRIRTQGALLHPKLSEETGRAAGGVWNLNTVRIAALSSGPV